MMPESSTDNLLLPMRTTNRPLRFLIVAALVVAIAALLWILLGVLNTAAALWKELRDLPTWAQTFFVAILIASFAGCAWFAWRMLRKPTRRAPKVAAPPTRADIDQRVTRLSDSNADVASLQSELEELDRRARSEELYVAVFGEISAGKSSLIRALATSATPEIDVIGGTTRSVAHYRETDGKSAMTFSDIPGTHEAAGTIREQIARDEALRAHVVLYVCAGDLTRDQDAELRWLRGFGKPIVLVLNKMDQFEDAERSALQRALVEKYKNSTDAQLVVSAGGTERFERRLADGRIEQVSRDRAPDISALESLLRRYAARGAQSLETTREAAVLSAVAGKADALEATTRDTHSEATIVKYTRRAVVGALAAVMPGTDLVIQGVLATGLIRELGKIYAVPVRDIDIDAFLSQVKLTLRTSTSIVLAIAGNVLKAFPGLGTVGGGALHAVAYGLIFDSLGHAVASTLRDQHRLDGAAASASLAKLLADTSAERMRRIVGYALDKGAE